MRLRIFYHANCNDGFAAAWILRNTIAKYSRDACLPGSLIEDENCIPVQYGSPPPPVEPGDVVLIVDFSYRRDDLEAMVGTAEAVIVLDHHANAMEALMNPPLPEIPAFSVCMKGEARGLSVRFNPRRSGAQMVRDWLSESGFLLPEAQEYLVQMVGERDLGHFDWPGVLEFHALLSSYPRQFKTWDGIDTSKAKLRKAAAECLRLRRVLVSEMILNGLRLGSIKGHPFVLVNAPPMFGTEIGALVAPAATIPVAIYTYDIMARKWIVQLRSYDKGPDVSAIAREFGGNGHKAAAGFSVVGDWFDDTLEHYRRDFLNKLKDESVMPRVRAALQLELKKSLHWYRVDQEGGA